MFAIKKSINYSFSITFVDTLYKIVFTILVILLLGLNISSQGYHIFTTLAFYGPSLSSGVHLESNKYVNKLDLELHFYDCFIHAIRIILVFLLCKKLLLVSKTSWAAWIFKRNQFSLGRYIYIFNAVKCSIKISHFAPLSTQWYVSCKNFWCHFKNLFKLENKKFIVVLLAAAEVIVLVQLPGYTDGHGNLFWQNHYCYHHHSISFFVNKLPILS